MTGPGRKVGRIWLAVTPGPRPLLFVHELGSAREQRESRLAAAREAWDGWVYTQRGHAPSAWAAGRFYRVSDFAVNLIRLLREGVGVPSVLVGEGAGGLVALLAAAAAPEWVTHLHLLPGTGQGWGAGPPRMLTSAATLNRSWLDTVPALPPTGPAAQDGDDPVLMAGPAELMHAPAVRVTAARLQVPWSAAGPHFLQDDLPARTRTAGLPAV